jgi:hypothetical protein
MTTNVPSGHILLPLQVLAGGQRDDVDSAAWKEQAKF